STHATRELAQLAEGEVERRARLRARYDRRALRVVLAAEKMSGVVEPRSGEPFCARHRRRPEHAVIWGVGADPEELPDRRPEALEILNRPSPQLIVRAKLTAVLAREPGHVPSDLGAGGEIRGRGPENLSGHG